MKEEELYGGVPEDGEFVTKPLSGWWDAVKQLSVFPSEKK
jgi:hypothetical protein